jgi:uncharacterized membrane protein YeaQ/YmgE (transglycosylase-associated protein family)
MDLVLMGILGAVAGWIASIIMKTDAQQGLLMDIVLGMLGGLAGGFVMNLIGFQGVTGFNIYSLVVSIIGAAALIWLGRAVRHATP